jgi:DNA-binding NarL/FixJ family response regulator
MTVAVVASDPLTADDIVTALRTHPRLRVLGQGQAAQAEAMLVLAPELDEQTLKVLHDADHPPREGGPRVVLVAERVGTKQLFRAVDHGLVSVLPRSRAGIDQIVLALLRTRGRRTDLDLPEPVVRALQAEILQLLAEGLSSGDIALALNCPEQTVKHMIHRSCTGLGLHHRTWTAARTTRQ